MDVNAVAHETPSCVGPAAPPLTRSTAALRMPGHRQRKSRGITGRERAVRFIGGLLD
jgi:hypothetical protein